MKQDIQQQLLVLFVLRSAFGKPSPAQMMSQLATCLAFTAARQPTHQCTPTCVVQACATLHRSGVLSLFLLPSHGCCTFSRPNPFQRCSCFQCSCNARFSCRYWASAVGPVQWLVKVRRRRSQAQAVVQSGGSDITAAAALVSPRASTPTMTAWGVCKSPKIVAPSQPATSSAPGLQRRKPRTAAHKAAVAAIPLPHASEPTANDIVDAASRVVVGAPHATLLCWW